MQQRYNEQLEKGPQAPSADQLDPRPLATVIVGSWASPLLTMTFRTDGNGPKGDSLDESLKLRPAVADGGLPGL